MSLDKQDVVELGACGGIFSYCTVAKAITLFHFIGAGASALCAVIILIRNWRKGV